MSALAQHRAMGGLATSGSDRAFDQDDLAAERSHLERVGVLIHPQDGSGVAGAAQVVASTAVETEIPDLVAARGQDVPVVHRADVLAALLGAGPSVAIAGTSGKSTVTAMTFEILRRTGRDPGLVTGGDLLLLRAEGLRGNAYRGTGPLVAEADESDGTLVKHAPDVGVVLNLHRDHMDTEKVLAQYRVFLERTRGTGLVAADAALCGLTDRSQSRPGGPRSLQTFGFADDADLHGEDLRQTASGSSFRVDGVTVHVPVPGAHNAENALAALAAAKACGVPLPEGAAALAEFQGVARRFQIVGSRRNVTVVDDFAHNPTKIAAALRAAQDTAPRVLAWFQPHGFAPARFMRDELADVLATTLRAEDRFWFGEIFYAGGSATRDLAAADLVETTRARPRGAHHHLDVVPKPQLAARVAATALPGDVVLVMGARDPSLPSVSAGIVGAL
ncbi:MAG: Mur ligase [Planctomycetes bacterium]|nr:Mur ligase [Planctomycetota bacterium]